MVNPKPLPSAVPILSAGLIGGIVGALPLCCMFMPAGPAAWFAVRAIERQQGRALFSSAGLGYGLLTGIVAGGVSAALGPAIQLAVGAFDDPMVEAVLEGAEFSGGRVVIVSMLMAMLFVVQVGAGMVGGVLGCTADRRAAPSLPKRAAVPPRRDPDATTLSAEAGGSRTVHGDPDRTQASTAEAPQSAGSRTLGNDPDRTAVADDPPPQGSRMIDGDPDRTATPMAEDAGDAPVTVDNEAAAWRTPPKG